MAASARGKHAYLCPGVLVQKRCASSQERPLATPRVCSRPKPLELWRLSTARNPGVHTAARVCSIVCRRRCSGKGRQRLETPSFKARVKPDPHSPPKRTMQPWYIRIIPALALDDVWLAIRRAYDQPGMLPPRMLPHEEAQPATSHPHPTLPTNHTLHTTPATRPPAQDPTSTTLWATLPG